jgi:hypothetical protein
VDNLNIQLCPTPQFYVGGHAGFRFAGDLASLAASLVSAFAMNSTAYPLTNGVPLSVNFPHGLAGVPIPRAVLLCTAIDGGFSPGEEIGVEFFFNPASVVCPFAIKSDAANIYADFNGGSPIRVVSGGSEVIVTSLTNFSLKIYWQ